MWTSKSICHVIGIEEARWKISLLLPPTCVFPSSRQYRKLLAAREGNKGARNSIKKRSKAKWNIVSLSVLLSFSPTRPSINHLSAALWNRIILGFSCRRLKCLKQQGCPDWWVVWNTRGWTGHKKWQPNVKKKKPHQKPHISSFFGIFLVHCLFNYIYRLKDLLDFYTLYTFEDFLKLHTKFYVPVHVCVFFWEEYPQTSLVSLKCLCLTTLKFTDIRYLLFYFQS